MSVVVGPNLSVKMKSGVLRETMGRMYVEKTVVGMQLQCGQVCRDLYAAGSTHPFHQQGCKRIRLRVCFLFAGSVRTSGRNDEQIIHR